MAGTISIAGSQQLNTLGKPLGGGKVWLIQAGTTSTPQNGYYDAALTLPLPYPIELNAGGRVPYFYLADGQIKVRITDSVGVTQFEQDNILVVGPSSGGGGGGGVDPTTVFTTGDVLWLPVQGTRTGWVRANARTIGSAVSGATERANADTSALFAYLWTNFSNTICPVSTGRGASAAADFAANKTITLLDMRGDTIAGLDDMGNSAASRYTGVPVVSGDAVTAGSVLGEATHTLLTAEVPAHDHGGATGSTQPTATVTGGTLGGTSQAQGAGPTTNFITGASNIVVTIQNHSHSITSVGGGGAHNNVQRSRLGSYFIKL